MPRVSLVVANIVVKEQEVYFPSNDYAERKYLINKAAEAIVKEGEKEIEIVGDYEVYFIQESKINTMSDAEIYGDSLQLKAV